MVVLVSSAISYVALVIALSAYVTNPGVDRPCRVRGWLVASNAVKMGCTLYFAADVTLRALAVATLGYGLGVWSFIVPPLLLCVWAVNPLIDEVRHLPQSPAISLRHDDDDDDSR